MQLIPAAAISGGVNVAIARAPETPKSSCGVAALADAFARVVKPYMNAGTALLLLLACALPCAARMVPTAHDGNNPTVDLVQLGEAITSASIATPVPPETWPLWLVLVIAVLCGITAVIGFLGYAMRYDVDDPVVHECPGHELPRHTQERWAFIDRAQNIADADIAARQHAARLNVKQCVTRAQSEPLEIKIGSW